MSTIPVVLPGTGWNLFAWPVQGSSSITESLVSIDGQYGAVYGYESTEPADPWRFYSLDPAIPDLLDNLHEFEFGRGYWITVTQPITLYVKGSGGEIRLANPRQQAAIPQPPDTFYGEVQAADGFAPQPGMAVQAWIDGALCGEGKTYGQNDATVYGLHVLSAADRAGCGWPGAEISFQVGGIATSTKYVWQGSMLRPLSLLVEMLQTLFMPIVVR